MFKKIEPGVPALVSTFMASSRHEGIHFGWHVCFQKIELGMPA
jgi:hypothetical protein